MKKILSLLLSAALICQAYAVCFSAGLTADVQSLKITPVGDRVTVEGVISPSEQHKLMVMAVYPDITEVTTDNLDTAAAYTGEFMSAEDGSFKCEFMIMDNLETFTMEDYPRQYTLNLSIDGFDTTVPYTFEFFGSKYVSKILEAVNNAKTNASETEMKSLIDTYYSALYLENDLYEETISKEDELSSEFIRLITAMPQVSVSDASEFARQFSDAAVLTMLNKAASAEELADVVTEYADKLDLKENGAYKVYNEFVNDTVRKEINGALFINSGFNDIKTFESEFERIVVLTSVNKSVGWGNIEKILTAVSPSIVKVDLSRILDNYDKSNIYGDLLNQNFANYESIEKKFDEAISAEAKRKQSTNSGSSSGSGSGSSGKGSAISGLPPVASNIGSESNKPGEKFSDLGSYDWAKTQINALAEKNIVNGRENGIFDPSGIVTREEFVKMLVLACGKHNEAAKVSFDDVREGKWYYSYIASAVENGIVSGVGNNTFGLGQSISREDMAVMISRLIGNDGGNTSVEFEDSDEVADYAKSAVGFLTSKNILKGNDGKFYPKNKLSRAEAAVVIYRYISYVSNGEV